MHLALAVAGQMLLALAVADQRLLLALVVNLAFGYQMVPLMMEDLALVVVDQRLLLVSSEMC